MQIHPYFKVLLATVFWSMSGPFIKYIQLPVTTLSFYRGAVPVGILALIFLWTGEVRKLRNGNAKLMLGASVLNALRMIFYYSAYALTTIGNAIILLFTWPILVALFGAIFLRERISPRQSVLFGVAFAGIVILTLNKEISLQSSSFLGMLCAFASAALYAATVVIFKKESANYGWKETIFYQNLVATFVFLPFIFIDKPAPTPEQLGQVMAFFAMIGILAFGLFFSALQKVEASKASLLAYCELVFAMTFGILFFDEVLTWNLVIGGVLIVGASTALRA